MTPEEVARLIDHTLLKPGATRHDIEVLCREGAELAFAAVCVTPVWVGLAARLLEDSGVSVCTVIGFPLGASVPAVKAYEAQRAIADGARELDMVVNVGALKSGMLDEARTDIEAVVGECRRGGAVCKVIIEAGLLTRDEKVTACSLARAAGADFVKTSTGFGPGGATTADVALMRRAVGASLGIKAAGGIRDLRSLERMVAAGATRIGTSAGPAIVRQAYKKRAGPSRPGGPGSRSRRR